MILETKVKRNFHIKSDFAWMREVGVRGVVIGRYILFSDPTPPKRIFRHELEHGYQQIREGVIKFYLKYFYYSLRYGYHLNPYEIEARKAEELPLTPNEVHLLWKLNEDLPRSQKA